MFNLNLIKKDREKELLPFLPETSIIDRILKPKLAKLNPTLVRALKEEIEIYRQIPKPELEQDDMPKRNVDDWDEKSFDPRHPSTCFMGKAFEQKVGQTTSALQLYRERVGTINHAVWGDVTLLEIWGADHFKSHPKLVKGVFRYCFGLRRTLPRGIKFHVNPLTENEKTGKMHKKKEQKEHDEFMEKLTAEALVFGVRTPEEARRARKRGR